MHACALEYLHENATKANAKILDVGCGSGYLSALFSRMNPTAHVLGVDYIPQLVALSKENTMKQVLNKLP
jgi:protein-L-isoaspartate(D-aspartate) O-methyltransferase